MRKLPFAAVLEHALASTRRNLAFAFYLSWPWMLLILPVDIWAEYNIVPPDPAASDAVTAADQAAQFVSANLIVGLLAMFAFSSIAVSWHRYILRDEVPHGMQRLRVDGVVWRYFGNSLLVAMMVMVAILPLALVFATLGAMTGGMTQGLMVLYIIVAVLVAMPVGYRLWIKLPAVALENRTFTFKDAWNVSRGNSNTLCTIGLVFFGAMFGIASLISTLAFAGGEERGALFLIALLLQEIVKWVATILSVTILTSLYGFFVEKREF